MESRSGVLPPDCGAETRVWLLGLCFFYRDRTSAERGLWRVSESHWSSIREVPDYEERTTWHMGKRLCA